MQRRLQARHGQVHVDAALQLIPGAGGGEPGLRLPAQQALEPVPVEAARHDHQVIGDALALFPVAGGDHDLPRPGLDVQRPPGEGAEAVQLIEGRLGLDREHAPVGALEELAAVRFGQPGPVAWIGVETVLVEALAARVEDAAAGQHVDGRVPVALPGQGDHDPGGRLAAADDTDVPCPVAQLTQVLPVTAAVQDQRMTGRLARYRDRRAGAGHDDPVRFERAAAGQPEPPAAALGVQRGHLGHEGLGPALHRDLPQVGAPLVMRGPLAAAIHPVGVRAAGDQVPRPAVGHHGAGHRVRGRPQLGW